MQAAVESDGSSSAANAAWAHRPGDNAFTSVEEVLKHTEQLKDQSFIKEAAVEYLGVKTDGESLQPGADDLYIVSKNGNAAKFNNHSFNQFCQAIGSRAGEWRKYPAFFSQAPLTWKAQNSDRKDVKMLFTNDPAEKIVHCRAVNSPTYGRIWNHELVEAVHKHVDPEIWRVPDLSAFHTKKGFITTNDRKIFIFLVNEQNPILLPGNDKPLFRGVYAWNSEVGDGTCGLAEFLLNQVCANRMMVGVTGFTELKIRHTSGAPDRWVREAVPKLTEYINTSSAELVEHLTKARTKKVAKNEKGAREWLQERGFTKSLATATIESAMEDERGADSNFSPYSVWNLVQGATAEARTQRNNDERVAIEQMAGRLMKSVF